MSHTLTNYNGVQIVTPEDDLSADRQALNGNFEFLADVCVRNPMTGNVDGGGFGIGDLAGLSVGRSTPALYSLTDTGTGITVATGQGANGYNAISVPGGSYLSGSALMIGGSPRVLAAVVEVIGSGNGDIVGQLPNYYREEKGLELFVVSTSCDILQDFRQSAVKSSQWSITSV